MLQYNRSPPNSYPKLYSLPIADFSIILIFTQFKLIFFSNFLPSKAVILLCSVQSVKTNRQLLCNKILHNVFIIMMRVRGVFNKHQPRVMVKNVLIF